MPELTEHDLHTVFHTAGHHGPVKDLTDRIMAQVAVTPIARSVVVEPVIGARGWIGIAAGTAVLITLAALSGDTGGTDAPWMTAAAERLSQVRLPSGNWPVWSAIAAAGALVFVSLDVLLRSHLRTVTR